MATTLPTFPAFYHALHNGRDPFPWQVRLADLVLREGWPSVLDLPTGVGKTSSLDVAVWALAQAPHTMPRRTVLVIDRRIVVDQAATHALRIVASLQGASDGPLRQVADALRALFSGRADDAPVHVAVLRGGMPRENDWASRPDVPVLAVSTVDQVGSRLLFRGYGIGERSRPIHAGLLGNDTLFLLDEVHLSRPFAQTLASIRSQYRRNTPGLPDRFAIVEMSATPGGTVPGRPPFQLDAADRESPVLAQRLRARKSITLHEVKVTGTQEAPKLQRVAEEAVRNAHQLLGDGADVVAVVLNRVDAARTAAKLLEADLPDGTRVVLLTGRVRPLDRDRLLEEQVLSLAGADRSRATGQRAIIVATQCIEAGADLDFDAMVTECPSLDALRQRAGRVDRRGLRGNSKIVVLNRSDRVAEDATDPVYGPAIARTWAWLSALPGADLGVDAFDALAQKSPPPEQARAPHPLAPVLLPMHLDLLAQTSPAPVPDPEIGLWLHGPERPAADVSVVWRVDITEQSTPEQVSESLAHLPPSSLEALSIPVWAARRWLGRVAAAPIADVDAGVEVEDEYRAKASEPPIVAFRWDGETARPVARDAVRGGDVLVVPASAGGMDAWGTFDPDARIAVPDLAELAALRARGRVVLRLVPAVLEQLRLDARIGAALRSVPDDAEERREQIEATVSELPVDPPRGYLGRADEWTSTCEALASPHTECLDVAGAPLLQAPDVRRVRMRQWALAAAWSENDALGFTRGSSPLVAHSERVGAVAAEFAVNLGLSEQLVQVLRSAGRSHDLGKHDPRFQQWLRGGEVAFIPGADTPLAKGVARGESREARHRARVRAGYPDGVRHEFLSVALLAGSNSVRRVADPDLALHLVASHHGWARPFPPLVDDPDRLAVAVDHDGERLEARTDHRLASLDSGLADRFWSLTERYGWWELAWLEAILRLADHVVSAEEERT
jgi:CRISPR-associated endonuclease/helicase Cas3